MQGVAQMHAVSTHSTQLRTVLADPRYLVSRGTPTFVVVLRGSPFEAELLAKYAAARKK